MKRLRTFTILLCISVLCIPQFVVGAPDIPHAIEALGPAPVTGSIGPILYDPFDYAVPAVAYNSARNEYLVVWHQPYDNTGVPGIFAMRFGAQGTPLGSVMTISADSQWQTRPDVVYDSVYNQYMIVWQDLVDSNNGITNIRGRIIDATEINPSSHEFYMAYDNTTNMVFPSIAYDPNNSGFMTTWTEIGASGVPGISAQRYDRLAAIPMDSFSWIDVASGPTARSDSDIAWDKATDRFVIVYQRTYSSTDEDLAVALLAHTGSLILVDVTISESVHNETSPAIASCANQNQIAILWQDQASGAYQQVKGLLFVNQIFSFGTEVDIGITPLVDNKLPEIACNHAGNAYIATWWEHDASLGFSAYARTVLPNGNTSVSATLGSPALTGSYLPMAPVAIAGGKTDFLVGWEQTVDFLGTTSKVYVTTLTPYQSYLPLMLRTP